MTMTRRRKNKKNVEFIYNQMDTKILFRAYRNRQQFRVIQADKNVYYTAAPTRPLNAQWN